MIWNIFYAYLSALVSFFSPMLFFWALKSISLKFGSRLSRPFDSSRIRTDSGFRLGLLAVFISIGVFGLRMFALGAPSLVQTLVFVPIVSIALAFFVLSEGFEARNRRSFGASGRC